MRTPKLINRKRMNATKLMTIMAAAFVLSVSTQCTKEAPDQGPSEEALQEQAKTAKTASGKLVAVPKVDQPNALKGALLDSQAHYILDSAHSEINFTVTKFNKPNRQEPQQVKGVFKDALSGNINFNNPNETKVNLNLEKLETGNPLRNANILEAFFATRPSAIDPKAVNLVWEKIVPVLARGEQFATFQTQTLFVKQMENVIEMEGVFIFWKRVKFFKSFRLVSFNDQNFIRLKSDSPIEINLPKLVGDDIFKYLLEAFLAAKCPHVNVPFDENIQLFVDLAIRKK